MENLIISIDFDKQSFPKNTPVTGRTSHLRSASTGFIPEYLAITVEDWIGPSEKVCHWLIWNIKARDTIPVNIPKDPVITLPFDAVQVQTTLAGSGIAAPARQRERYIPITLMSSDLTRTQSHARCHPCGAREGNGRLCQVLWWTGDSDIREMNAYFFLPFFVF